MDQSFQEKLKSQVRKVLAPLAIRWEGSCHTAGPCLKVFDLRNAVKIDNVSRWKPEKEVEPDRSFYYLRMCRAALQLQSDQASITRDTKTRNGIPDQVYSSYWDRQG